MPFAGLLRLSFIHFRGGIGGIGVGHWLIELVHFLNVALFHRDVVVELEVFGRWRRHGECPKW